MTVERCDARVVQRHELIDAQQNARLGTRHFLADKTHFIECALGFVVGVERKQQRDVAPGGIGLSGGEDASLGIIGPGGDQRQAGDQVQIVEAPLRERRPPSANARRCRPWRHRNDRLRVLDSFLQSDLWLSDMANARSGAEMTARDIEQPRRIAAAAANDDVDHLLTAQAGANHGAPELDHQFFLQRRWCLGDQAAQKGHFASGSNGKPRFALHGGELFGKLQTLREQREQRLIDSVDVATNRVDRIGWGGLIGHLTATLRAFLTTANGCALSDAINSSASRPKIGGQDAWDRGAWTQAKA